MITETLYEPEQFEPLIDAPWIPSRVEDAIAAIASDAAAAFEAQSSGPSHDFDAYRQGRPLKTLYSGAAGVIWALAALRQRGHAETSLDLAAAAVRALELERGRTPALWRTSATGPARSWTARPGPCSSPSASRRSRHSRTTCTRSSGATPPTRPTISAGAPPGLSSPLWRWPSGPESSAGSRRPANRRRLFARRRGGDGLWRQDDDYHGLGTLHGAAGNTLALLRLQPDDVLADETAAVLARHVVRAGGLANWPGSRERPLVRPRDGRICLQWCTGAPGVVAGASEYLDEDLLLAAVELIWRAGPHGAEKGHGLCHGTSGNGSPSSRPSRGRRRMVARPRPPAPPLHALAQAERLASANGRRYSLFTGDIGTALFAVACLDADPRFPIVDVM